MSKLTHLIPNYEIATGDVAFPAMQVGGPCMVVAEFSGLVTSDTALELHQSIDGNAWGIMPDSSKVITAGQESHQWNISGLISGAFIRVGVRRGSAAAGIINAIKVLSNG